MELEMFEILEGILGILSAIFIGFAIPILKKKFSQESINTALNVARIAVRSAEQIFTETNKGIEKKDYVLKVMKDKFPGLSDKEAIRLIESAVYELNMWQEELNKEGEDI